MRITIFAIILTALAATTNANDLPDITTVEPDLITPKIIEGEPSAGKRVKHTLDQYKSTEVYHAIYLPRDWKPNKKYPVIVEYAGNGPYKNKFGDICSGKVEDCNLGYGISGGEGVIWVCLPYISEDGHRNQLKWWGEVDATVNYCKKAVAMICKDYGGDRETIILAGFSRGAIACNYIGLHDDEIAQLWAGMICHSHYDGVRQWGYDKDDRAAAAKRLKRLGDIPQFISHEGSIDQTRAYLKAAHPTGRFTFQAIPYRNHTDAWVLRDIEARKKLREWVEEIIKKAAKDD